MCAVLFPMVVAWWWDGLRVWVWQECQSLEQVQMWQHGSMKLVGSCSECSYNVFKGSCMLSQTRRFLVR